MSNDTRFELTRRRALGSAAIAAAMLGLRITGEARAQEVQVAATPVPLGSAVPPEAEVATDWFTENKNFSMDRNAGDSAINASNVASLELAWSYAIDAFGGYGALTMNPLVSNGVVYVQDMLNNVHALDERTGELLWRTDFNTTTIGPNGLSIGYGIIAAGLGDTSEVVALNAETGGLLWRTDLSGNSGEGIDMAPLIYDNTVYVSTVPGNSGVFYRGGQKGIFYALDITSGHTMWQWDTTTDNLWGNARVNSGGGLWHPPSVDADGHLYLGIANAGPWPGNTEFPNGSSRPGDNDYANSLVKLDPQTGSVDWYINIKPFDLFDLDNQLSPVLATATIDGAERNVVLSTGKHGLVVCADQETGEELWRTPVGRHENDDLQEVPEGETVVVYPGALGGVETPFAVADGVVYLPVINLPAEYSSTALTNMDIMSGTGEMVALDLATGEVLWTVETVTPLYAGATVTTDVVFSAGLDGVVRGFSTADGSQVWTWQTTGINAPFAAVGDTLLIPAGGLHIPSDDTVEADESVMSAGIYALRLPA
ncbi:MAG: PQQ-binding-like beta-propeller repeat protein [Thermomicrobiales bacterium]|nr:PQQ-binding-like beta-propeller repeat protein [Thermomicrobiales bacterium]